MALFDRWRQGRQPGRELAVMGPSGEIEIYNAAVAPLGGAPGMSDWWQFMDVHEPFPGAFQRVMTERRESLLAFSAVYSCVGLISGDIAKLPIRLVQLTTDAIWEDIAASAFNPVLRKPNRFQTRIQFIRHWITAKLLFGNSYMLKERDNRNVVVALYPLHPAYVTPLVTDSGDVWYELAPDNLAGIDVPLRVPASEIIHDRMNTLFHPLVGVSPLFACALTATQGQRIQNNSAKFFENMSRPSGQLTAPGRIDDTTADRLKREFEMKFGGGNLGRLFVSGSGLHYEPMTIPARDAQLIDQLKWTVEDVARAFLMPLHKLAAGNPTVNNAAQYNLEYFENCVQIHLEEVELLLDEGLGLGPGFGNAYGVWLDEENLMRMDSGTQMETIAKGVRGCVIAPNEGRRKLNLRPVKGGNEPLAQHQDYPLSVLANRTLDDGAPKRRQGDRQPPDGPAEPDTPATRGAPPARSLAEELALEFENG
jgi:HK97 family phage portal protein